MTSIKRLRAYLSKRPFEKATPVYIHRVRCVTSVTTTAVHLTPLNAIFYIEITAIDIPNRFTLFREIVRNYLIESLQPERAVLDSVKRCILSKD
jgi:hypothetical protein